MTDLPREVSEYFKRIGRKGGSRSSQAKREAARRNIAKRWRLYREAKGERPKPKD